jgi:membrane fusion protein, multidrug efflux system
MRKKILLTVALLLVAGAFGGWRWWTVGRFVQSTDDAYVQADISIVSPKVEGYVRDLPAVENQTVKAGDVLLVIDPRDYEAKLAQSEAAVAASRAALQTFDSRLVWQRSMVEQATASVAAAEADLKRTQQDYERYQRLLQTDAASRQRFDAAQADAAKARAALEKARAALLAEKNQVGVLQAQRGEEEARLLQVEAQRDLAKIALGDTVVRAPVDGIVGNKAVQPGQYVKPGNPLLAVVPLPAVHITANFKETQLARVRPGQTVEIEVDAYKGRTVEGRVESFAPATGSQFSLLPPENATGNFTKIVQRVPVRITVPADNPLAGLLRPGLSFVVSVDTRQDGEEDASKVGAAAPLQPRAVAAADEAR